MTIHLPDDLDNSSRRTCEADGSLPSTRRWPRPCAWCYARARRSRRPAPARASAPSDPLGRRDGQARKCSLTSAVSSTLPRTHDLPHGRRAYPGGRFGPPCSKPTSLSRRRAKVQRPDRYPPCRRLPRPVRPLAAETTSSPRKSASALRQERQAVHKHRIHLHRRDTVHILYARHRA